MKTPPRLQVLIAEGLINSVSRQLRSGKEAEVFVVRCGDDTRAAKVYKAATHRSFRQAVDYTENRKVRNSRQARAMAKGTRYGREQQEAAWQSAEVDALSLLAAARRRVPKPFTSFHRVLLQPVGSRTSGPAERSPTAVAGPAGGRLCAGGQGRGWGVAEPPSGPVPTPLRGAAEPATAAARAYSDGAVDASPTPPVPGGRGGIGGGRPGTASAAGA